MPITINTKSYNLDATVDVNKNQYTGPAHNVSSKDLMTLARSRSATTDTFPGYARSFAKFTRTIMVNGKPWDAFGEVTIALPVGCVKADADALRNDLGEMLKSANGDDLVWKHDINQ